ncbi:MAG TPA: hypothetical protein VJM50_17935 [Pyrinomonadaceae bacterium]|nr:hypothetical protein [Pyrinomonadaceae bacterium]
MRTKSLPFQLEQKHGGAFAVQGLAGGMLLGFILTVALLIANPHPTNLLIVFYIYPIMVFTGVFGLIKSIPFGFMYHVLGIRTRVPMRIFLSTISLTLFASYFAYERYDDDPWLLAMIGGWCFLISLPTALLVGSRVRPWEILNYWRVTFRKNGIKERLRSSGILALGGVLPLRLLSLGALGIWIVATAGSWPLGEKDLTERVLVYVVPIAYLGVSAYLTFSSPSQFVLLAIGLVLNLPITYIALFGYNIFPEVYWQHETRTYLAIADTLFISAWTAFVATRFIVQPEDFLPEGARACPKVNNQNHHDCLGSRFLEWREHAA